MSTEIGTYTFLPWLRQGIANRIDSADLDPAVKTRASINVQFELRGTGGENGDQVAPVDQQIALYGPGDIIGVESRAIVNQEPGHWATNFEPNYLPYIEFYDESFPFRYTPAAPNGGRLRPWLSLIVLTEEEFEDGKNIKDKPLPYIDIKASPLESVFPVAEELWAWVHVHVNQNLAGSGEAPHAPDVSAVKAQLDTLLEQDPDRAYSRLLCPRKLAPKTGYHALLVPTFETGRLAGLGLDPQTAPHATFSAWGPGRAAPTLMPVYHRWYFRTATRGDFEYLVRLLEPRVADARVGRRDIDVQAPGSNISGIDEPALEGVLKLGGALLAPLSDEAEAELQPWEAWDDTYPHPFQSDLAQLVNLPDDYARLSAADANQGTDFDPELQTDPDPVIAPPIYGRWHALTSRLLLDENGDPAPDRRKWLHQLNLDPRWRSAAGFGTDVVIDNQEAYMDAAWDQVGEVLEGNRKIRCGQLAWQVSQRWYDKHLVPMQASGPSKVMLLCAPVQKRVLHNGLTVFHQASQSAVTPSVTSGALRRMIRPRGRIARYAGFEPAQHGGPQATFGGTLIDRVNRGEVTAAPPNTVPPELPTVEDVVEDMVPKTPTEQTLLWLRRQPWFRIVLLVLLAVIVLLIVLTALIPALQPFLSPVVGVLVLAFIVLVALWSRGKGAAEQAEEAQAARPENQTPESVDDLPGRPDFVLTPTLDIDALDPSSPPDPATGTGTDNDEAIRFKAALRDAHIVVQEGQAAGLKPALVPLDIAGVTASTVAALDPTSTILRHIYAQVRIPGYIRQLIGTSFVEAMAYPAIDLPMYKPLVDKSTELFVPNLKFIKPNTITLLNTNQRFIESYMVGLNHEMARELLWREYPTDQRGSYFRQFWDVRSFLSDTEDDEQRREELYDIPPIHRWARSDELGDHDHREASRENEEELVLVIRGELLKRYPNAVIYAQKAMWQPKSDSDSSPDKTRQRVLDPAGPILTPLYEAKVDPDIHFLGFDLVEDEARGDPDVDDKPGWFFVIRERPGEARFGFDISRDGALQVWNDLAWPDVVPGLTDGDFVVMANVPTPQLAATAPTGDDEEKAEQWAEDQHLQWTSSITSAELAYILFQSPVLAGIHAADMLPPS